MAKVWAVPFINVENERGILLVGRIDEYLMSGIRLAELFEHMGCI